MRPRERLHDLLDRLFTPPQAVPVKRTWSEYFNDLAKSAVKRVIVELLHFSEWLIK